MKKNSLKVKLFIMFICSARLLKNNIIVPAKNCILTYDNNSLLIFLNIFEKL